MRQGTTCCSGARDVIVIGAPTDEVSDCLRGAGVDALHVAIVSRSSSKAAAPLVGQNEASSAVDSGVKCRSAPLVGQSFHAEAGLWNRVRRIIPRVWTKPVTLPDRYGTSSVPGCGTKRAFKLPHIPSKTSIVPGCGTDFALFRGGLLNLGRYSTE